VPRKHNAEMIVSSIKSLEREDIYNKKNEIGYLSYTVHKIN
jgi:hypothetical protein